MSHSALKNGHFQIVRGMFSPQVLFNQGTWWAWLIFAAALVVTALVGHQMQRGLGDRSRYDFERALSESSDDVDAQMQQSEIVLRSAAGLLAAQPGLSRQDWRRYAQTLDLNKNQPALQALLWAPRIERAALVRHVASVRSTGLADYAVFPNGDNQVLTPVTFVEPFSDANLRFFGYDMSSSAERRAAMQRARDTGQPAITSSLVLISEAAANPKPGFLMYFPVFASVAQAGSGQPAQLQGYVAGVFRMQDFMRMALHNLAPHIRVQVYDDQLPVPSTGSALVFDNRVDADRVPDAKALSATVAHRLYGHTWRLEYSYFPAASVFYKNQASQIPQAVMAGVVISALLFLVALSQSMLKLKAARLAQDMTGALRASEERWQFALESSGDGVVDWNLATNHVFYSHRAAEMLGYRQDEMPDTQTFEQWQANMHPDDRGEATAAFEAMMQAPYAGFQQEYRLRCKDGSYLWMLVHSKVVEVDLDGKPQRLIGTRADITTSRKHIEQLRLAAKVLEHSSDGIMITDSEQRIVSVNPAFSLVTGYAPEEAIGATPQLFGSGRHDADFYRDMWTALRTDGMWQGEIWNRRKNGDVYPEWLTVNQVRNEKDRITHYVGIFSDITVRKATEAKIQRLAHFDPLTHLPNRTLLQDRLQQGLAATRRKDELMAVLFLDLDHFKTINDTLGHHDGDELLKLAAARLMSLVREGDTVARQGGDEFIIVLPNLHSADDAALVAQKLVAVMAEPYNLNGRELTVTVSVGISILPTDASDIDELTKHADAAMYQAKEIGRNTYQFYTEALNQHDTQILNLEHDLRRATERGQLVLFFQPQMRVTDGVIIGAEALVRWQHPDKGLIAPGEFIPIAEERGVIIEIGTWILNEACRQNQRLQRDGGLCMPVAVNISAMQFRQPNFVALVKAALQQSGLPAQYLELELTESIVMHDTQAVIAAMHALRQLGVRMSIDDFGTGYSSLGYLKRMPIDKLKIDQSFVRDINVDPDDAAIVAAVIHLAHCLKMQVIAEGVETVQQLALLQKLDCDEIQGFLFSKPLAFDAFSAFLKLQVSQPAAVS